jgi:hypothetical protein
MIIEMAASAIISIGGPSTHGASETAWFVMAEAEEGRRRLQDSYAFGMVGKGVLSELLQTVKECRDANWDGYGAKPVSDGTYHLAQQFLKALPLGTPAPSIGAEPDGHLTVEWYRSARRTLSVSISPEGDLHYAALIGSATAFGTEPFFGEAPRAIVDLIHRVMAI